MSCESVPRWLREIPEHLKTPEMCTEVVAQFPYVLWYVPDYQKMCDDAVHNNPAVFFLVPDHFKPEDMCIKAIEVDPWSLRDIPDNLKKQEMCDKAIKDDPSSLQFLPDWFVTQEQLNIQFDDDYWYHDDEIIEWYKGYKKRQEQKAKIEEELLPIAWHLDRVMNWCVSKDVWK